MYPFPSFVLIPIPRGACPGRCGACLPFLPVAGCVTPAHWVLPVIVLAACTAGYLARLTRAAMLEVLRQDYMRTAAAKGLFPRQITWRHAFRNALLPIVTVLGLSLIHISEPTRPY